MPPHSSHKLQPLDVACFAPLKILYGRRINDAAQKGIQHIDKCAFLYHYQRVHYKAFNKANIKQAFASTGLLQYNPDRVLHTLKAFDQTPSPPSTSSSNQSIYLGKTPLNLYQLNHQKAEIRALQESGLSSFIADQALEKIYKGAEMAMQNTVLLQQELQQLHAVNQYKKDKSKPSRRYLQEGGTLDGQTARHIAQIKDTEAAKDQAN